VSKAKSHIRIVRSLAYPNVYRIWARKDKSFLGSCRYLIEWREWIFEPHTATLWSAGCLDEVSRFLRRKNTEAKK